MTVEAVLSGACRIFPVLRSENVLDHRVDGVAKNLYRGKGTESDGVFHDQSLIIVGQHPKALDLAALNCADPAEEGVAVVQTVLSGIGAVADLRRCRHDQSYLVPA